MKAGGIALVAGLLATGGLVAWAALGGGDSGKPSASMAGPRLA